MDSDSPAGDEGIVPNIKVDSEHLTRLGEQKTELLTKVQTLKKELLEWRSKLDGQVKSFRGEITDLRRTLNTEVDSLRTEFLDLKSALKQQLDLTSGLATAQEASPYISSPVKTSST